MKDEEALQKINEENTQQEIMIKEGNNSLPLKNKRKLRKANTKDAEHLMMLGDELSKQEPPQSIISTHD